MEKTKGPPRVFLEETCFPGYACPCLFCPDGCLRPVAPAGKQNVQQNGSSGLIAAWACKTYGTIVSSVDHENRPIFHLDENVQLIYLIFSNAWAHFISYWHSNCFSGNSNQAQGSIFSWNRLIGINRQFRVRNIL